MLYMYIYVYIYMCIYIYMYICIYDYLKEAEEQLSCKEMYSEVTDEPSYLTDFIIKTLDKNWERGQLGPSSLTLAFTQKIFLHFQNFILNLLWQKLIQTSRILTTFLENF